MKNYMSLMKNKNVITSDIKIGNNVVSELGDMCKKVVERGHIGLVYFKDCDKLACNVATILNKRDYKVTHICYAENTQFSLDAAEDIVSAAEDIRLIVAVGSGALSDLVRYAAFKRGTPHMFVATAPSTYCMFLKSVDYLENGEFKSEKAAPPCGVILDLEVLSTASDRMFAAGYGEIFGAQLEFFEEDFRNHTIYNGQNNNITLESFKRAAVESFFENSYPSVASMTLIAETLACLGLYAQLQPSMPCTNYLAAKILENEAIEYAPFGINRFLATITIMKLYEKILNNTGYLLALPTNICEKTHKYAKAFKIETTSAISRFKWSEEYEKDLFIYEEFRREFAEYAYVRNNASLKHIKGFRRIFNDAGYWLREYVSADEVIDAVKLASLVCDKSSLLAKADVLGLCEI